MKTLSPRQLPSGRQRLLQEFLITRVQYLLVLVVVLFCIRAAQAAPVRIVVYGDSGVAGKRVLHVQAYPEQLQRMLHQKGFDASVVNRGETGRTSADAAANLEASVPPGTNI